jgi:hypothetical protein
MKALTVRTYALTEMSEHAKEAARDWYRRYAFDDQWWDSVYDDSAAIADILGIDLRTRILTFRNGTKRYDGISIGFSGFSSQGDGAHFEGTYRYAKGATKAIREYAPLDTELHRIADALQAVQRKHFYGIKASVVHSGHYQHEYCTNIEVEMSDDRHGNYRSLLDGAENEIQILMRDFMRWIYRALEREYDYQNQDEAIDEQILMNDYHFTDEGSRQIVLS